MLILSLNFSRGLVLCTGGTYIFFDGIVSSPGLHLSTSLGCLILRALQYHQPIHSLCTVPSIVEDMIKICSPIDLERLRGTRLLGVGGAPASETIVDWAIEQKIPVVDISGATEAVGTICARRALDTGTPRLGLQVLAGLEGFLEKERITDTYGELIIRATASVSSSLIL